MEKPTLSDFLRDAEETAEMELEFEKFRDRVEAVKERLRRRRWWHRLIPYTIIIQRRPNV